MHLAAVAFLGKRYVENVKRHGFSGYRGIRIESAIALFSLLLAGSVSLVHAESYDFALKWGSAGNGQFIWP